MSHRQLGRRRLATRVRVLHRPPSRADYGPLTAGFFRHAGYGALEIGDTRPSRPPRHWQAVQRLPGVEQLGLRLSNPFFLIASVIGMPGLMSDKQRAGASAAAP